MSIGEIREFKLADLESFSAQVFTKIDPDESGVAGLVLSFALAHNDLADVAAAWETLKKQTPKGEWAATPEWGEYGGLIYHLQRQYISLIFSVVDYIVDNENALKHPLMKKIVDKMNKRARAKWKEFVAFAVGGKANSRTYKVLLRIRNKVTFHYDPAELLRGFRNRFDLVEPEEKRTPYISRGATAGSTRYHFADGAAQQVLGDLTEMKIDDLWKDIFDLTIDIQNATEQIVMHYVQLKDGAWRNVAHAT